MPPFAPFRLVGGNVPPRGTRRYSTDYPRKMPTKKSPTPSKVGARLGFPLLLRRSRSVGRIGNELVAAASGNGTWTTVSDVLCM